MSPEREAWYAARQRYRWFCLLAIVVSLGWGWSITQSIPVEAWLAVGWLACVVGFLILADHIAPGERPD